MVSDLIDHEYRERVMTTSMFRHPGRDRKRGGKRSLIAALCLLVAVGAYFAFAIITPLLVTSWQTSAGTMSKTVWGYVYDSLGAKVDGIIVTVTIEDPGGDPRATLTSTSFAGGMYTVTFPPEQWDSGDTIRVSAEYELETAANSTVIAGEGAEMVDLHFTVAIPEFGPGITVAVTVSVLVVAIGAARKRLERGS